MSVQNSGESADQNYKIIIYATKQKLCLHCYLYVMVNQKRSL